MPLFPRSLGRMMLCVLPVVVMASCTEFDQKWANMPPPMTANPAAIAAGKWEGTWQSDATSYSGHLQSIVVFSGTTVQDKDQVQQYQAEFHQRMFDMGPVRDYTVNFTAQKLPDGRIHIEGRKDLGYYYGGIFHYDGYIYPEKDEFYCDYNSDKDTGTFKMRRITQALQ